MDKMQSDILYQLWLNEVCAHEPEYIDKCVKVFGNAESAYKSKLFSTESFKAFGVKRMFRINKSLDEAKRLYEDCIKKGIRILYIDDIDYPERLKNVYCPPKILYIKGEFPKLDNLSISIVGTRKATKQGIEIAEKLAYELASIETVIVSGMACGIDSAAQRGALKNGGKVIAVLAGGVDIIYPRSNEKDYHEIVKSGAIVSERPPGCIGKGYFYQQRNRIIVGLSLGTVIVEGQNKSGTAITARLVYENNRDLFAVPGNPTSKQSELPNQLISDGAVLTRSALDIVEQYTYIYPDLMDKLTFKKNRINSNQKEKLVFDENKYNNLNDYEKSVIKYICERNEPTHIDDILENCNISASDLNFTVTMLEIKGLLVQKTGSMYLLSNHG